MANYVPKDYVPVHKRVQLAHEKYGDKLNITTDFDIKDNVVIFKATVRIGEQVFTGSSFGEIGKEKAFEKLETVAVGRALAFAGFEIQSGIASADEMEKFQKQEEEDKSWFNDEDLKEWENKIVDRLKNGEDVNDLLKKLREKYKVSKKMAEKIVAMSVNLDREF